jgi:hypothetical protein
MEISSTKKSKSQFSAELMVTTSNDKGGDSKPNNAGAANKKCIVIPMKRQRIILKAKTPHGRRRQRQGNNPKKGGGLPSFQPRVAARSSSSNTNNAPSPNNNHHEDDDDIDLGADDFECEELPCDTFLAIQSLQKSSQGLHIPIGNQQMIQAILESQIFQRFEEGHASTIMSELLHLVQTNQVRKLKDNSKTKTAFVLTRDYVAGVWDAHQQQHAPQHDYDYDSSEKVVSWFVSCLKHWTESTISKESMEEYWKDDITKNDDSNNNSKQPSRILLSLDDALKVLLKLQVLIRDSSTASNNNNDERYYLWLPQWGLVLKTWNEARQQLMGFVARSRGGEVSETNLLNQNRHSCISTRFLLNELTHDGKLRIVQRPFGTFVQRVVHKK